MATLTLTLLGHPELGDSAKRQLQGGELTIGRDAGCGWALPDPTSTLSRQHCRLLLHGGAWQVEDLSSNGTFVNAMPEAIGRDNMQVLRDRDRLLIGDYEIEVGIGEHHSPSNSFGTPAKPGFSGASVPGLEGSTNVNHPVGPRTTGRLEGPLPFNDPPEKGAFVPPLATPPTGEEKVPEKWWEKHEDTATSPVAAQASTPTVSIAVADGDLNAGLAALIAGGNLPPEFSRQASEDPEGVLRSAGALLSVAVSGVRALLIGRSMIKREFRIGQTTFLPKENNPLKFAASDEHALAVLLNPRTKSLQAMQESMDDLALHQVAVMAATQSAVRALLKRLEPQVVEAEEAGSRSLLETREKRLWEAYKRRHAKLVEQFDDDFESAFGMAFARAYEQAVNKDKG